MIGTFGNLFVWVSCWFGGIHSVEWESDWEVPIDQLRLQLGIWEPPLDFDTWKIEEARLEKGQDH